jgi:molybdate transport system substrate-binding protein
LIAAKDGKIDNVTIGPGFDLAKLAGDGRVVTGDVRAVPVGLYDKLMSTFGTKRTSRDRVSMSAFVGKADIDWTSAQNNHG